MKRIYIIILSITIAAIGFAVEEKLSKLTVIVAFKDLEPFEKQLPVYYRGFKVGKSSRIYPDKNYKNTYVKLNLEPADVQLPKNIIARVQKSKRTDFINLIAPEEASVIILKNGDVIQGEISRDINSIISDKLNNGGIDTIFDDATTLMESANITVKNLGEIFAQVNSIITETRGDIKLASSNLAAATTNLKNMSANLDSSLDKKTMQTSVQNLKETTENIKGITANIDDMTKQINETTLPVVNSILCHTHGTAKNTNEITGGINCTLKERMGLGKLFFGRPVKKCN